MHDSMRSLYQCLLYLYPTAYRREYAKEMAWVILESQQSLNNRPLAERMSFNARETAGLLCGAAREHLRLLVGSDKWIPFRRFDMRPEFRFPRSTVFLMTVVLAGVLLAIEKATQVEVKYGTTLGTVWPALPVFFLSVTLILCALAATVWAIMFALRRTGVHRLANVQTWPDQR
jgi:hypothetical protein